jgi:hypothetical protein
MNWHQKDLMGQIGAEMVAKSPQMASLVPETICGCMLVPETA